MEIISPLSFLLPHLYPPCSLLSVQPITLSLIFLLFIIRLGLWVELRMGDKERKVGQENTEESMSVRKYDEKEESEH